MLLTVILSFIICYYYNIIVYFGEKTGKFPGQNTIGAYTLRICSSVNSSYSVFFAGNSFTAMVLR